MNRLGNRLLAGSWCLFGLFVCHVADEAAGGTIVGTVTYKGSSQEEEFIPTKSPNADYCVTLAQSKPELFRKNGEIRLLRTIDVREDGALKDAIVSVRDIVDETFVNGFPGTKIVIQQCEFRPYTSVVVDKRNFHVVNLDPANHAVAQAVMHNPHGIEVGGTSSRTLFNIALAEKDAQLNRLISLRHVLEGSSLKLVCDQHAYMQSWFLPVTNPYYATSAVNGRYEIHRVPAGKHLLKAWHPRIGSQDIEVIVPQEGTVQIDIELPSN